MDTEKPREADGNMLVNATEEYVRRKVEEVMSTYEMCHCAKCFRDACAIVLNALHPHYATTEKGKLFYLVETTRPQYRTEMAFFVLQALQRVKDSPRHRLLSGSN